MHIPKKLMARAGVLALAMGISGLSHAYNITAASSLDLMDFGTSATAGLQSSITSPLNQDGVSISFTNPSGVYSGNIGGLVASPFGNSDKNYLAAEPKGSMTLQYNQAQNSFGLLWGTVDSYNSLNIQTSGGDLITGTDIANAIAGINLGSTNQEVWISDLSSFNTINVSSSKAAFEFVPTKAVPEPGALTLLGLGLLGIGLVRFRNKHA